MKRKTDNPEPFHLPMFLSPLMDLPLPNRSPNSLPSTFSPPLPSPPVAHSLYMDTPSTDSYFY